MSPTASLPSLDFTRCKEGGVITLSLLVFLFKADWALGQVADLQYASPATISRCGMVYVDARNLGCRPAYLTWLASRCAAEPLLACPAGALSSSRACLRVCVASAAYASAQERSRGAYASCRAVREVRRAGHRLRAGRGRRGGGARAPQAGAAGHRPQHGAAAVRAAGAGAAQQRPRPGAAGAGLRLPRVWPDA